MRGVERIAAAVLSGMLRPFPFHRRDAKRTQRVVLLLTGLAMLSWTASAHAGRFIYGEVEVTTPNDTGWMLQQNGTYEDMVSEKGGSHIETHDLEKLPP